MIPPDSAARPVRGAPPPRPRICRGFTLIALLVVIAISPNLAARLLPALSQAKEKPKAMIGYFRTPSDAGTDLVGYRSVPRHGRRVSVGFFEGHAEHPKNSLAA